MGRVEGEGVRGRERANDCRSSPRRREWAQAPDGV
jgi:hypothetical protein